MRANYRLGDLPAVHRKRYPFPMSWHQDSMSYREELPKEEVES